MSDNFDHIHPLDPGKKPNGYWTYERCKTAAKACGAKYLAEWQKLHKPSYIAALRRKYTKRIAEELGFVMKRNPNGYWTKVTCETSARECGAKSLSEWQKLDSSGYGYARENNWARDIAKKLGWNARTPAGFWDYNTCKQRAKDCGAKSLSDWSAKCSGSYAAARGLGIGRKIAKELGWESYHSKDYWTYARCRESAKACGATNTVEWRKLDNKSFSAACRRQWTRKISIDLGWNPRALPGQRTFEECLDNAKTSGASNHGEWQRTAGNLYYVAHNYGWTKKIAEELNWNTLAERGSYTFDVCREAAKSCGAKTITEWRVLDGPSYAAACNYGWTRDVAESLNWKIRKTKPAGYWTDKNIIKDAKQSGAESLSHWARIPGSGYAAACAKGIHKQIAELMGWVTNQCGSNKLEAVVYWYFDGEYVYVGETGNPDARHDAHFFGRGNSIVYDYIDIDVEPEYAMNKSGSDFRYMSASVAKRVERMLIGRAVRDGYKVLNKVHNPQWDGTRFSWEDPLEEAA